MSEHNDPKPVGLRADPPSVWIYGQPPVRKCGPEPRRLSPDSWYPEKDVDCVVGYCRMWTAYEGGTND